MPAAERCWLNAAHCHPWYADCRGGCPRWSLPPWMDRESRRAHSRLRSEAVPARDRSRHIECGTASSLRWARYTVDTNQGRASAQELKDMRFVDEARSDSSDRGSSKVQNLSLDRVERLVAQCASYLDLSHKRIPTPLGRDEVEVDRSSCAEHFESTAKNEKCSTLTAFLWQRFMWESRVQPRPGDYMRGVGQRAQPAKGLDL